MILRGRGFMRWTGLMMTSLVMGTGVLGDGFHEHLDHIETEINHAEKELSYTPTMIRSQLEFDRNNAKNTKMIVGREKILLLCNHFANDGLMIGKNIIINAEEIDFGRGIFSTEESLTIFTKKYSGDFCHQGSGKVKIFINRLLKELENIEKPENPDFFQEERKNQEKSLFTYTEFPPLNASSYLKYLEVKPLRIEISHYINQKRIDAKNIEFHVDSFMNHELIEGETIYVHAKHFNFGTGTFFIQKNLIIHTDELEGNPRKNIFGPGNFDIYVNEWRESEGETMYVYDVLKFSRKDGQWSE
jgi:hypothetical protein